MAYIYDLSDQWAASGTVFTGIKLNVTDTASAANSLLMDLQVGGVEEFQVVKDGQVLSGRTATSSPTYSFIGDPDTGWGYRAANTLTAIVGGSEGLRISSTSVDALTGTIGASLGGRLGLGTAGSFDIFLNRDAANTLAQRNGVNAQAFNLYNTYTDASNYERGVFDFTSVANQLTIGTTKAGTGASRLVRFVVGGTRVAISDGAYFQIDKDLYPTENIIMAAKYTEMAEMTAPASPAANKVRIYAEDDGAGKTRLMARFATGAAVQIAIEP